jgi:hypothetical protein
VDGTGWSSNLEAYDEGEPKIIWQTYGDLASNHWGYHGDSAKIGGFSKNMGDLASNDWAIQ